MIHKDIKPENLIKVRGKRSWKYVDYGIGINLKGFKIDKNREIQKGIFGCGGTVNYMDPEFRRRYTNIMKN